MRLLVTGDSGFVGPYAIASCKTRFADATVSGLRDPMSDQPIDIRDRDALNSFVNDFTPTDVLHLAAVSNVPYALTSPQETWDVNATGAVNLFTALAALTDHPNVVSVSSSEVYGATFNDGPVDETSPLRPLNPYAASKAASDMYVLQLMARGLPYVVARPFNHVGVGQSEQFVLPSFAKQIARAEASGAPIEVGNLDAYRNFLTVESVADAYATILGDFARFSGHVVNICAHQSIRIESLLEELLNLSSHDITVIQRPDRLRAVEIHRADGIPSNLLLDAGWRPTFDQSQVLQQLLDHARAQASAVEE